MNDLQRCAGRACRRLCRAAPFSRTGPSPLVPGTSPSLHARRAKCAKRHEDVPPPCRFPSHARDERRPRQPRPRCRHPVCVPRETNGARANRALVVTTAAARRWWPCGRATRTRHCEATRTTRRDAAATLLAARRSSGRYHVSVTSPLGATSRVTEDSGTHDRSPLAFSAQTYLRVR